MSKVIDLTSTWEKYKGQWVAFDKDYHVVSAAKDAKDAYQKAKQKGQMRPILFNMPRENIPYFGGSVFAPPA